MKFLLFFLSGLRSCNLLEISCFSQDQILKKSLQVFRSLPFPVKFQHFVPVCIKVYLELYFWFFLENLNPLRPLQDLPGKFQHYVRTCNFFVNMQYSVLNFRHLTIFFPEIMYLLTILLKKIENVKENPVNLQCATHKH